MNFPLIKALAFSYYFPQVLPLNVTFRAGGSAPTSPRVPWQLLLRSRGAMAEASESQRQVDGIFDD